MSYDLRANKKLEYWSITVSASSGGGGSGAHATEIID